MKYYNETTKGFYDSKIHKVIPPNSIEISDELHQSLLQQESIGRPISVVDGKVTNINPTLTELDIIQSNVRKARRYLIDTDFYFTIDKYDQLTKEKRIELLRLREAARVVIRGHEDI